MRKVFLMLVVLSFAVSAFAIDLTKGDAKKGKDLYRENCKSCHDGSKGKRLHP